MSTDPFDRVKDLVLNAKCSDSLKAIQTRIRAQRDNASLTLLFGGNPVEGQRLDPTPIC